MYKIENGKEGERTEGGKQGEGRGTHVRVGVVEVLITNWLWNSGSEVKFSIFVGRRV
jgi:hypothetical protein